MRRDEILETIQANREKIRSYGVASLSLFGSFARNESSEDSDIDLLVAYESGQPGGLFEFLRLLNFLEDILGRTVDLVMSDALREDIRQHVLQEAIRAA